MDAQSGHEKTLTGLLPALAGANLIYGLGMLESGMTIDYGQLVLDHEIARFIKQTVAGIPVSDETLMVGEIKKVGAFGDFLSLESTMRYMRGQSRPKLIDRRVRDEWVAAGSTDVYQRALEEARRILAEHRPLPLPDGAAEEMHRIVTESEVELATD